MCTSAPVPPSPVSNTRISGCPGMDDGYCPFGRNPMRSVSTVIVSSGSLTVN
ncbi:hypothetical protein D1872_299210 [compost metagenome]